MYCVKCGVELEDSQKQCPLCKTVVFHPDLKQPEGELSYPEYVPSEQKANPKGVLFILTCILLLPIVVTLTIDLRMGGGIGWSGYVAGAIIVIYTSLILPTWFKKPNPVVFVPVSFTTVTLYLLYICVNTEGEWFLTLAFPITAVLGMIITAVTVLTKYLRRGYLYIASGVTFAFGLYCILIEILIYLTYGGKFVFWSLYPFVALFIIGGMLLTIAICKPLRRSLERKFFI